MFRLLFILFVIVPIIEIAVLMQVGGLIGAWPTVAVVIVTAWLGAKNVKQQGLSTLQNVQNKMAHGEMPSDEIVTGLLLLVAGVLLVTPGFVTDAFGLLLLVPPVRQGLIQSIQQQLVNSPQSSVQFGFNQSSSFNGHSQQSSNESNRNVQDGQTIEGEYERKE